MLRRRKGGARAQAIGISRGGRTTKIHALVDLLGRPLRLALTPGNTSDIKGVELLVDATARMKRVIADRGYDANRLRAALREQGTIPVRRQNIRHNSRRRLAECGPRQGVDVRRRTCGAGKRRCSMVCRLILSRSLMIAGALPK
ncbi:hypothetical protein COA07_16520 [Sphingomonas adhaesiva]|uniref:Transposase IS4-like domain-containing protein n=1 Tax=Sphingomonas adhaesiva TaxID=28212 RepID=A0A2A4I5M5_9SPHN|nr:hypothetical protein COA07_16520 [Sphingomonas adhaesiva]